MKTAKKINKEKIERIKKKISEKKYIDKAIGELAREISAMFI